MNSLKTIIVVSGALLPALMLHAQNIALQSFVENYSTQGSGATAGWEFQANSDITVTELGWNETAFGGSLPVGLWTLGGALLGQVTVTSSGDSADGFYYTPLSTAVPLTAGDDYLIGGLQTYSPVQDGASSVLTAPQVTYVEDAYVYADGGGLGAPIYTDPGQEAGYFGPNFQFEATAVPEDPSTLVTFALLLTPFLHRLRRFTDKNDATL